MGAERRQRPLVRLFHTDVRHVRWRRETTDGHGDDAVTTRVNTSIGTRAAEEDAYCVGQCHCRTADARTIVGAATAHEPVQDADIAIE